MVLAGGAIIKNVFEFRAAGIEMIVQPAEAGMPMPGEPALAPTDDSKVPEFVFFIYDHLGNTRVMYSNNLVDCDPAQTEYLLEHVIDYYPYAKTLREYVYERERFQSTYHERDEETGLDYRGARFYDSDVGRFLSVDPLSIEAPDWTPFRYAFNNPLRYLDPDGLFEDEAAARKYAEENDIKIRPKSFLGKIFTSGSRHNLVENSDGTFSLEKGNWAIEDLGGDLGVSRGLIVAPTNVVASRIEGEDGLLSDNRQVIITLSDGTQTRAPLYLGGTVPTPGKGYKHVKTIGDKFEVFQKTVKAKNLGGQARAVYTRIKNKAGKTIRFFKDAFKRDGRHYERANKFPHQSRSRKLD